MFASVFAFSCVFFFLFCCCFGFVVVVVAVVVKFVFVFHDFALSKIGNWGRLQHYFAELRRLRTVTSPCHKTSP